MTVTAGTILAIVKAAGESMSRNGLLDAAGNFVKAAPLVETEEIAAVAGDVEAALKAGGLVVPSKVDKIVASLPGILQILSVSLG